MTNIIPNDNVLTTKYENLTANQKKFADYLIEKGYMRFDAAIEAASKVKKFNYEGKPRTLKVEKMFNGYKYETNTPPNEKLSLENLITFKNFLREYYEKDEEERIAIWEATMRVNLEEALEYSESFNHITYFSTESIKDYSRKELWNKFAAEEVGKIILREDYFGLSEQTQLWIYDLLCPIEVFKYFYDSDCIVDVLNPDWWEESVIFGPDTKMRHFYANWNPEY